LLKKKLKYLIKIKGFEEKKWKIKKITLEKWREIKEKSVKKLNFYLYIKIQWDKTIGEKDKIY